MLTFHFEAGTSLGHTTAFTVVEHDETIASTEAKITVERWLAECGCDSSDLSDFNLTHTHH